MARLIAVLRTMITAKQEGAALAEYGLLIALIAAACIVATQLIGQEVSSVFEYLKTTLQGVI